MLPGQRMGRRMQQRVAAGARSARAASTAVRYPRWYLQRWHFLPEGYLSRRSAALYEWLVRHAYNSAAEPRMRTAVRDALRAGSHSAILEVGSGPGLLLADLARGVPGASLTGVDLSPYMLERAAPRVGDAAELVHANAAELPFEPGRFDAVIAVHVLGHVPARVASVMASEACRVLRAGGRLYVVDHSWHPATYARGLRRIGAQRLLGGLQQLTVFERAEEGGAAG